MQTSIKQEISDCPNPAFADFDRAVKMALSRLRRHGVAHFIDTDDLRQEAQIALFDASPETLELAVVIAQRAMLDYIRSQSSKRRGNVDLDCVDAPTVRSTDDFSRLPVFDACKEVRTLASRHNAWEVERAAVWVSVRSGGVESLQAVA